MHWLCSDKRAFGPNHHHHHQQLPLPVKAWYGVITINCTDSVESRKLLRKLPQVNNQLQPDEFHASPSPPRYGISPYRTSASMQEAQCGWVPRNYLIDLPVFILKTKSNWKLEAHPQKTNQLNATISGKLSLARRNPGIAGWMAVGWWPRRFKSPLIFQSESHYVSDASPLGKRILKKKWIGGTKRVGPWLGDRSDKLIIITPPRARGSQAKRHHDKLNDYWITESIPRLDYPASPRTGLWFSVEHRHNRRRCTASGSGTETVQISKVLSQALLLDTGGGGGPWLRHTNSMPLLQPSS